MKYIFYVIIICVLCLGNGIVFAEVIVDNEDGAPSYLETGTWLTSSYTGYNGGTYRYANTGGLNTATWTADLSSDGTYEVMVWFRQGINRATSAKYDIYAADSTYTVYCNQQSGDYWKSLGSFLFNAGENLIIIDAAGSTGGGVIVADAVKFVEQTLIPEEYVTQPLMRYGFGGLADALFSADGKFIVFGSGAGAILWDVTKESYLRTYGNIGEFAVAVDISDDGRFILTGSGTDFSDTGFKANLFDTSTGQRIRSFVGHTDIIWQAMFSPDESKILTSSTDNTAKLWDVEAGSLIQTFMIPGIVPITGTEGIHKDGMEFSPEGNMILSSIGRELRVWNSLTGELILNLAINDSIAHFSPDGSKIISCTNSMATLWDIETGSLIHDFIGHSDTVTTAAFSQDGSLLVTGSDDTTARLWDTETGLFIRSFEGHSTGICSAYFTPDRANIITTATGASKIWNVATGEEIYSVTPITVFWSPSSICSPNGETILFYQDSGAIVFDLHTLSISSQVDLFSDPIKSLDYSPDGQTILVGDQAGFCKLWGMQTKVEC